MEDDNRGEKRKEPTKDSEPEKESEALAPPPKKFRLNSGQLWLTYPKCPISKEDALLQISAKVGDPKEYIIAEESHKVEPPQGFSASDYMQWAETQCHLRKVDPVSYQHNTFL